MAKKQSTERKTVVLASGGTGGHIFPAEALAHVLTERGYHAVLITDKRYAKYVSGISNNWEVLTIRSSSMSGGVLKKAKAASSILLGYMKAKRYLKKLKPVAVVGFGGYPSFPTMLAATRNGYHTILHEQNSLLGQVNYFLADKVDVIATSFPEVSGMPERCRSKVQQTGNPVRHTIRVARDMAYSAPKDGGIMNLLVTGGSQGATVFSQVVPEAIANLKPELRKRIRIDQQCRAEDLAKVKARYEELSVSADLASFFEDIPSRLSSAHLVIARSGASTIAELAVAGRPAIMVPYPSAKDDHQTVNANMLEDQGGGWLMPQDAFTAESLAQKLEHLLTLPDMLSMAAEKMRAAGQPDADKKLCDVVLAKDSGGKGKTEESTDSSEGEAPKKQRVKAVQDIETNYEVAA